MHVGDLSLTPLSFIPSYGPGFPNSLGLERHGWDRSEVDECHTRAQLLGLRVLLWWHKARRGGISLQLLPSRPKTPSAAQ